MLARRVRERYRAKRGKKRASGAVVPSERYLRPVSDPLATHLLRAIRSIAIGTVGAGAAAAAAAASASASTGAAAASVGAEAGATTPGKGRI